ncbi:MULTISPECIES: ATP-binding protein [Streptomyces]|uniref:ATP-binding protein n=1 Tax=Streptomyces scabiei TaxID=1930 RepID=UPI0006897C2E|nr:MULTISPECIES: ATP-binding protein [Streptomyces]MDX2535646.1 ATP-binding protein [Streptomyces scabiei]MDX2796905.1 ATP-binding protein [Streptomyces scabiei]MDX2830755.1 ATP-binding protein [Streptomyces scabiei]MDX2861809.1 ATP-binding protein [Streptomyces scabiei]MDX3034649.1 ATP-binding protein [Streptomyces scabiei]
MPRRFSSVTASTIGSTSKLKEVSDPDKAKGPALRAEPDPQQDGGRDLVLVAALAERWGHETRPFTKCVWAYFVVPGGPR